MSDLFTGIKTVLSSKHWRYLADMLHHSLQQTTRNNNDTTAHNGVLWVVTVPPIASITSATNKKKITQNKVVSPATKSIGRTYKQSRSQVAGTHQLYNLLWLQNSGQEEHTSISVNLFCMLYAISGETYNEMGPNSLVVILPYFFYCCCWCCFCSRNSIVLKEFHCGSNKQYLINCLKNWSVIIEIIFERSFWRFNWWIIISVELLIYVLGTW